MFAVAIAAWGAEYRDRLQPNAGTSMMIRVDCATVTVHVHYDQLQLHGPIPQVQTKTTGLSTSMGLLEQWNN